MSQNKENCQDIKVISFNIWDLPLWFVRDRKDRIAGIAKYFKDSDADIICLQESFDVKHRQLIHKYIGEEKYYVSDGMAKKRHTPFILIPLDTTGGLVTFSKFPIIKNDFFQFSRLNYSLIEYFGRKGILETVVETPFGNLQILNTHLNKDQKFFSSQKRFSQLKAIFEKVEDHDSPAVLVGDFNEHDIMQNQKFARFLEGKKFTHPLTEEEPDLKPSYRAKNPYVDNWWNRVPFSKRLDYMLVKHLDKIRLRVSKYAPVYLEPALSDHDPVLLEMTRCNSEEQ